MLRILQAWLQQYVNHELPDVQVGFRKGRGTRDQIANIHRIVEKAREFQKNIYFCFIDYSHLFENFPQFIVIHTVKGFGIVNKAKVDVFLELFRFFDDPGDVGSSISGSSAFSKSSLNIRKFTVQVLLKPGLENFAHYFASM